MCTEPLGVSQISTQDVVFPAGDKLILAALCLCLLWKNLTAGTEPLQTYEDGFNVFPIAIDWSSRSNLLPAHALKPFPCIYMTFIPICDFSFCPLVTYLCSR